MLRVRLRVHLSVISTGRDVEDIENSLIHCCVLGCVYRFVYLQRFDEIRYNINKYYITGYTELPKSQLT
jgi:hypothetical protein